MTKDAWGVVLVFENPPDQLVIDETGHPRVFRTKFEAEERRSYQAKLGFKAQVVKLSITYSYFRP